MTHAQFAEWAFVALVQDQYSAFNYKMLTVLRDLNFGANFGLGFVKKCTQQSTFEELNRLAQHRFFFDSLRTGLHKENVPAFVVEAHKRIKK